MGVSGLASMPMGKKYKLKYRGKNHLFLVTTLKINLKGGYAQYISLNNLDPPYMATYVVPCRVHAYIQNLFTELL